MPGPMRYRKCAIIKTEKDWHDAYLKFRSSDTFDRNFPEKPCVSIPCLVLKAYLGGRIESSELRQCIYDTYIFISASDLRDLLELPSPEP